MCKSVPVLLLSKGFDPLLSVSFSTRIHSKLIKESSLQGNNSVFRGAVHGFIDKGTTRWFNTPALVCWASWEI